MAAARKGKGSRESVRGTRLQRSDSAAEGMRGLGAALGGSLAGGRPRLPGRGCGFGSLGTARRIASQDSSRSPDGRGGMGGCRGGRVPGGCRGQRVPDKAPDEASLGVQDLGPTGARTDGWRGPGGGARPCRAGSHRSPHVPGRRSAPALRRLASPRPAGPAGGGAVRTRARPGGVGGDWSPAPGGGAPPGGPPRPSSGSERRWSSRHAPRHRPVPPVAPGGRLPPRQKLRLRDVGSLAPQELSVIQMSTCCAPGGLEGGGSVTTQGAVSTEARRAGKASSSRTLPAAPRTPAVQSSPTPSSPSPTSRSP